MTKGMRVIVADNSGALTAEVFGSYGGFRKLEFKVGDIVMVAIKKAIPNGKIKSGTTSKAVIVRSRQPLRRKDGSVSIAGENAIVLINNKYELIGTSVFGWVAREAFANSHYDGIKKMGSMVKGGIY